MKDNLLYRELKKYTFKTMLLTLLLFTLSFILTMLSIYVTVKTNIKTDYKIIIDVTTALLIIIMLYISYVNYNLRQNMFMLYNAYTLAEDDDSKKKFLLRLETLFVIYDLTKLRELAKREYHKFFSKYEGYEK